MSDAVFHGSGTPSPTAQPPGVPPKISPEMEQSRAIDSVRVPALFQRMTPIVLALLVALLVFQAIAILYDQAPLDVLSVLWQGTWGTGYGLGQVLFKSTPLIFTGLSVALAFRAGLFNIGAEGQAALGALAMGHMGASLPAGTPSLLAIPLCLLSGIVVGGLWGAIPGLLKARFGAHEVITTIMLNFIAFALSSYLVVTYLAMPETLHTRPVVEGAQLSRLDALAPALAGAPVNSALFMGIFSAALVAFLLFRTTLGYQLRVLGLSLGAAEYGGIQPGRMSVWAMTLAGALAGLTGASFVLGYKHYHEEGFTGGVGFLGIAVALLGRSHPGGVLVAALLFGTLAQGGLAINAMIPKDSMDILQAVIVMTVACAGGWSHFVGGVSQSGRRA